MADSAWWPLRKGTAEVLPGWLGGGLNPLAARLPIASPMPKRLAQENHRKTAAEVSAVTPRTARPRQIAVPGTAAVRLAK